MQLIQFMPLIQFNIYYILHINNNDNNVLVIDFMQLIQFMLLIIGRLCYRDLRRQAAATPKQLWTEAQRAEDQSLQRPGSRPCRSVVAYKVGTAKQVIEAPPSAEGTRMEAPQTPLGWSLVYNSYFR